MAMFLVSAFNLKSTVIDGTPLQLNPPHIIRMQARTLRTMSAACFGRKPFLKHVFGSGNLPGLSSDKIFPGRAFGSRDSPALLDDDVAGELAAMTGILSLSNEVPRAPNSMCVGIDPDLSGAIAVLKMQDNIIAAQVLDVPCLTVEVNKKRRRRHDYKSIAALVKQLQAPAGSLAYVEHAMPYPKDGKQGWYITGYGYGMWLGILAAAGFTVFPVQARVWKAAMGLCGKEFSKDDSRALASSLFPVLSPQLRRKKDHGRAEALLIAAFGKGMTLSNIPSLDEPSGLINSSPLHESASLLRVSASVERPF